MRNRGGINENGSDPVAGKVAHDASCITAAIHPDSVATASKFLSLEAFRGIAALMVVLYHSRFYADTQYVSFVRHSDIFVDFFFILSGFVMAHSYLDKIPSKKIGLRKFIILRFGRLVPLHLATLFLWVPYIAVKMFLYQKGIGDTNPSVDNNVLTFASNLLLLQALDGYQPLSWNYPSWSISAEFYTYIFFFFFVLLVSRFISSRTYYAVSIALVAIGTYALTWMLDGGYGIELFIFQCIGGFFLGVVLYLLYRKVEFRSLEPWQATFLEVVTLAFLVYCVVNKQEQGFRNNVFFYMSIISFACVIYVFVIQQTGFISRFLKHSFFQFIGKLSYSIYMLHAIVLAAAENLFVYVFKFNKSSFGGLRDVIVFNEANYVNLALVLIVIFVSAISFHYIEVPCRERFKKVASRY